MSLALNKVRIYTLHIVNFEYVGNFTGFGRCLQDMSWSFKLAQALLLFCTILHFLYTAYALILVEVPVIMILDATILHFLYTAYSGERIRA